MATVLNVVAVLVPVVVAFIFAAWAWRWCKGNLRGVLDDGVTAAYRQGVRDGWAMRQRWSDSGLDADDYKALAMGDGDDWRMRENAN